MNISRLSLFRGESEEGMPWEILFPIRPHPPPIANANAMCRGTYIQQQTARCAVMMTWGGER